MSVKHILGFIAVVAFVIGVSGVGLAAEQNFSAGNRAGDAPYEGEYKSRQPGGASAGSNPDNWKYAKSELKRSGLNNIGNGASKLFSSIFGVKTMIHDQEERYLARKNAAVK